MKTIYLKTGLNKEEIMEIRTQAQAQLKECQWRIARYSRALERKEEQQSKDLQRLAAQEQRAEETSKALEHLSESHLFHRRLTEDLYKTKLRIEKLRARTKSYSVKNALLLELKVKLAMQEAGYYEGLIRKADRLLIQWAKPEKARSKSNLGVIPIGGVKEENRNIEIFEAIGRNQDFKEERAMI